jgi:hypothetical protein
LFHPERRRLFPDLLQKNLPAPSNFNASLQSDGLILLSWSGLPLGASSVLEVQPFGSQDWLPLSAFSGQSFQYFPGDPNAYDFRVKFVLGNSESPYAQTASSLVVLPRWNAFLPMMRR